MGFCYSEICWHFNSTFGTYYRYVSSFCVCSATTVLSSGCVEPLFESIIVYYSKRQNKIHNTKQLGLLLLLLLLGQFTDVAYCYRPSSMVCFSVDVSQYRALHKRLNRSRCHLGWEFGWAQATMLDRGPDPSIGRSNFEVKGQPTVKYRDTLQCAVQKWRNWSRCHLSCALRQAWALSWNFKNCPEMSWN